MISTRFKLVIFVCILGGCARPVHKFPAAEIIPSVKACELDIYGSKNPLQVLYLGCGHLVIRYGDECIIVDPFFSTQGFTQRKIKSDLQASAKYKKALADHNMDLSLAKSVWIAHTHYDHMMDIPLMFDQKLLRNDVTIYGNEFGDDILTNFISHHQYKTFHPADVYDHTKPGTIPKWISVGTSVRVLPILSDHAPHYKVGPVNVHLMKGDLDKDYFKDHYVKATDITKRKQWKEGCTYSFLVDFMNDNGIQFRIFIQTSASSFPRGRPPAEILNQRKTDVAFLCVASSNYVKPYPVEILKVLKPEKVVFIHWEDFFLEPLDFDSAKLVRFTNFRKLNKRLERNGFKPTKEDYVMPRPGTMITIK